MRSSLLHAVCLFVHLSRRSRRQPGSLLVDRPRPPPVCCCRDLSCVTAACTVCTTAATHKPKCNKRKPGQHAHMRPTACQNALQPPAAMPLRWHAVQSLLSSPSHPPAPPARRASATAVVAACCRCCCCRRLPMSLRCLRCLAAESTQDGALRAAAGQHALTARSQHAAPKATYVQAQQQHTQPATPHAQASSQPAGK